MQHSVVGVMMVQGERIFILILKVNKLFSLFFIAAFSIRNRKHMFSMSLLSKRKTLESLGELEKEVETVASWLVFPQHFLFYQTSIHVFIN